MSLLSLFPSAARLFRPIGGLRTTYLATTPADGMIASAQAPIYQPRFSRIALAAAKKKKKHHLPTYLPLLDTIST